MVAEAFATVMPSGATGVVRAGALVSPKPGPSELLVQDELALPEQLAFLVVHDVATPAPIGTSRSVAGGAEVVEASGGAIGASGGAIAGRRGRQNIPGKNPWSSSTPPISPLGGVRQVVSEAW